MPNIEQLLGSCMGSNDDRTIQLAKVVKKVTILEIKIILIFELIGRNGLT